MFELTFAEFATPKIARRLFIVAVIYATLQALGMVIYGGWAIYLYNDLHNLGIVREHYLSSGIASLVLAPFTFLGLVVIARVVVEFVLVVFRIEQNLRIKPTQ